MDRCSRNWHKQRRNENNGELVVNGMGQTGQTVPKRANKAQRRCRWTTTTTTLTKREMVVEGGRERAAVEFKGKDVSL